MSFSFPLVVPGLLKKRRYGAAFIAVTTVCGIILFLQKIILTWVVGIALSLVAASANCELHWKRLEAGLFLPMTIEEVQIRTLSPGNRETSFRASQVVLQFSNIWNWLRGYERLFSDFRVEGLTGIADFRSLSSPSKVSRFFLKDKMNHSLMLFPLAVEIRAPDLNVLFDGITYRLRNFSAKLREDSLGEVGYSFAKIETSVFEKNLPASSALATWKSGILSLVQWPLLSDCSIAWISIYLVNPKGLGIDFDMAAFNGTAKGSLLLQAQEAPSYWDVAVVAQQIELGALAKALEISTPVRGILKEGKFTFRGKLNDIARAEASVHVSAEEFHWNDLGWQILEFGADLIHSRIAIPEFYLRQKENFLYFKGSAWIPESLQDFSKTPFEVSVLGDFQDLAALSGLLGPQFQDLRGRMTLDGSLWSGNEGPNGYFKLEASPIEFGDAQFTSARINTILRNGNAEILSCELWNGEDCLLGRGNIDLNAAHSYSGEISLRTREIESYRSLLGENLQKKFHSGEIQFTWQGDGASNYHSGAFSLQVKNLISSWTPSGVIGHWEGTFSPGYISFNRFELSRDALRLVAQMSASPFGVQIDDFQVIQRKKQKVIGSGFLPMDVFALLSGNSWQNAMHSEKPIFLNLTAEKMELAEFCDLIGQKRSLSGLLQSRVSMAGQASTLQLNGQFSAKNLQGKWNGQEISSSTIQIKMEAAQCTATLAASLVSQKIGEVRGTALLPLHSEKNFANLLDFSNPFHGSLQIEKLDVSLLKIFFPAVQTLDGKGKANLSFENTLSYPKVNGQFALTSGLLGVVPQVPLFSDMHMEATISENRISLNKCEGNLGKGTLSIKGEIDFAQGISPQVNLKFTGEHLLLYQDPSLTLNGNIHLLVDGGADGGRVSGVIRLQNSELRHHVEMAATTSEFTAVGNFFSWENKIPEALPPYGLDVSIINDGNFLVKGKLTQGEIVPSLQIRGNLRNILPAGSIKFKNLRAFFPFAVADVPQGVILFDPKIPYGPMLDTQAFIETAGAVLEVTAAGPLQHPRFSFTSNPPLPPHSIALFLLTGRSPWQENTKISSSKTFGIFPLQKVHNFTRKPDHFFGAYLPEEPKISLTDLSYEFPETFLDYRQLDAVGFIEREKW